MCLFLAVGLGYSLPSLFADDASVTSGPATYEIMINGESFLVDADHAARLESKEKPGVSYQVAVRVAPTQRIRMNHLQFTYDLPAKVETDPKKGNWVQISTELGATMLINDLGGAMTAEGVKEELDLLVKSVSETFGDKKLNIGKLHSQKFENTPAQGATIRYQDAQDIEHVCLVYIFASPQFTAACVVEYLEPDADDVLPIIKKTLDSIEALPKPG
jgi:hypothetical protein